ncbi:type II toxin-antitoxin system TacA family antitoxin [Methylophaga thalassica]|uniref:type II toxin-antitoxin system TacA family antitoxin n=1 Tax=Methylophaga aminisulfidivorans TaxID=230105 RepID=UPI003A931B72
MATTLPRITARVDVETQDLLTEAAAIAGMSSINSFVLSAAIEKAKQVIEREQSLKLTQADAMLLMEALDRPTKSNSKLKAASKRYENKTQQ